MHKEFLNGRVLVKTGDITAENVDAIVNAANSSLLGGAGVDGAIHEKGGPAILEECRDLRKTKYVDGLSTGEAVITTAGNLAARYVVHTVGPIYGQHAGREAELLANSYRNSLELAVLNGARTIAFPSISTGAFGYPKQEAARISSDAVASFLERDTKIEQVRLVFYSQSDAETFISHATLGVRPLS